MKRRVVGVASAVLLAAVGTFVLVAYVGAAEDRALAGERTVDVLVVAKPIEKGTAASELGSAVKEERVPAKVRAEGAVTDLDALGDKVASVSLAPGEQVVAGRFVERSDLESVGQVEVPNGMLQVTVALSPERAVGGLLQPGSTVGVVASFDPFESSNEDGSAGPKSPNSTHFIVRKALVSAVQRAESVSSDNSEKAPSGALLVTMALSAENVEKVVFTAEHGSLWLAFEPQDAPEGNTQVITRAEIYS